MLNLWQQMNIAIHDEDIVTLLVQVNVRVGKNSQNTPPPYTHKDISGSLFVTKNVIVCSLTI